MTEPTATTDLLDVLADDPATADVPVAALLDVARNDAPGDRMPHIALALAAGRIDRWRRTGDVSQIDTAQAIIAVARCHRYTFAALQAEVMR